MMKVISAALLVVITLGAVHVSASKPSNKWRLQFSGAAHSDGTIVMRFTPMGGEQFTTETMIANGTGENAVAKRVVESLRRQLSKDHYHVERDDGEDVLVKKRFGSPNFLIEILSNTVEHVRINPDRE